MSTAPQSDAARAGLGVGVDIGGTKVAAGLVDADGTILDSIAEPTPAGGRIAALVADLVGRLRKDADAPVAGIGVGAAGFVGADRSTVTFAPNIDWRDEPLGADVARLLDLPVVVENDANAAAWGEYRFGAGADSDDLLLVTIGTGVGGGVIQEGDLVRGGFGAAAEIGHLRLVRDGRLCGCGQYGCLEQYASGSALVHDARERAAADDPAAGPLLARAGSVEGVTGPMVTDLAQQGDPLAVDLLHDLGTWIGEGCASLAAVLDPTVIVIGGGVGAAGELLLEPVRAAFEEHLPARFHRRVAEVRLATLGNDAGIVGAADLGRAASAHRTTSAAADRTGD
jgi:glucokinase